MNTIHGIVRKAIAPCAVLAALLSAAPSPGAVTKTELAGNVLGTYPFFEYVRAINANSQVHVAIDPSRFPAIIGQTCDIYVVAAKDTAGWIANNTLTDVTFSGMQTQTFGALNIQANTFLVTGPFELSAAAGTGLGVGYDVVLDCNQNALLDGNDYIDGPNNESGFYVVHDTTAPGPYAVTELTYTIAAGFGIPATHLAENTFFPTTIATLGRLPLIVISHGNGHNYQYYDHIGNHLASYGYIVMSHANNTGPGPVTASTTTLGHTDAFIAGVNAGTIPGGAALTTHLNADKIVWIGHSRGGEGVTIAYDRIFDGTYVPVHYAGNDIKLISSMLPTDFEGTLVANAHNANYHLWTASGDSDVDGSAGCDLCQTYHLQDRAVGHRQSTTVQGTGHTYFHNGPATPSWFSGPCAITRANTHAIELGHFLPLVKRYVDDNIPSIDFLTRQYESFRPMGAPTGACVVVTHEYYDASNPPGTVVIDNYQTNFATNVSSIGAGVTWNVTNLTENRLDDNNANFTWMASDPFNGATQGALGGVYNDQTRGVVFDWAGANRFYEWAVPVAEKDFTNNLFLSFRGAQGTQHPNTVAVLGDLTFKVTLRDTTAVSSSISIGAYGGGGIEEPYQRPGGGHNEMESIRIRLTDFLNNYSNLNLANIAAIRLDVGPTHGSSQGRLVIDDLVLTNDRAVYDGGNNGDPHITTVSGENYDFQSAGEFTALRGDEVEIQTRQTPVSSAPAIYNAHTGLASCVSINTAVAVRVAGRRVTYQPSLNGDASPDGLELRVDGTLVDLDVVPSVTLGPGAKVAKTSLGIGIQIDFPDGATLAVVPGWWSWQNMWYLNLIVKGTPASEGIMGLIPSGSWLPRLPNGSSMGARPVSEPSRYADLNVTFANAWRVSSTTSLFDYATGMSTLNFTDRSFPPVSGERCDIPGQPPIIPIAVDVAEELCRPVLKQADRESCVFDVAQTGEPNFATTYIQVQTLEQRGGEQPPKN